MPNLYNIYDYMDEGGNSYNPEAGPWGGDPEKDNSYHSGFYSNEKKNNGEAEAWLKANGIKYSMDDDYSGGEAGFGNADKKKLNIDWGSMPKTKFGTVNMTTPMTYKDGTPINKRKALDPRYVYNDPNYGKISHAMNVQDKQNPFFQYAGPGIMALAGMGMGSIAGAAGMGSSWNLANTAVQTARGLGSGGNWRNAALNAGLSLGGSYLGGLSPEIGNAIKYGKQAYGLYNMGRGLMGSRGGKG